MSYKNILTGYINDGKKGGKYLTITNVGIDPLTIEPGEKIYLNMTPADVKAKYPKVPDFSKSVKEDDGGVVL